MKYRPLATIARLLLPLCLVLPGWSPARAQTNSLARSGIDARMMRYPDVSATQLAFVYAGDIWLVPKTGGLAERLSSPKGEEIFPRFSPDGSQLAFSGSYDGNLDIYVVPTAGGLPRRLTFHGGQDRVLAKNSRLPCHRMISGVPRVLQILDRPQVKDRTE